MTIFAIRVLNPIGERKKQRSDAGHSHVTHTKKDVGYSDEVWSRSLKPRLSYGQLCRFTVKMHI